MCTGQKRRAPCSTVAEIKRLGRSLRTSKGMQELTCGGGGSTGEARPLRHMKKELEGDVFSASKC